MEHQATYSPDDIEDEDTSLLARAEDRAERFDGYSENRARDAQQAHAAVEQITSGIPLGQPILVGHHSEKRARKDAEKIENGMRRAIKAFETSKYWERRAAGAIAHAKYKELPSVRARRIKKIESEYEYAVVDELEWETPACLVVHFENAPSCGFPPDHVVTCGETHAKQPPHRDLDTIDQPEDPPQPLSEHDRRELMR